MTKQSQIDFENMALDQLSDFIVNTHHVYVREAIPSIKNTLKKVVEKHAEQHSELNAISSTFGDLAAALEEHMVGEEKYLFPFVKKMLNSKKEGTKVPKPPFGALQGPLKNHVDDHQKASDFVTQINKFTNNYTLPEDACEHYDSLYKQLNAFEKDLEQHIYLENEILFKKCIDLEKEVVES